MVRFYLSFRYNEMVYLCILDTAGQVEFTAMRDQYMRCGEGFIICYSVTDRHSFQEASEYRKLIARVRLTEDIPLVLIANKLDLQSQRKVSIEIAIKFSWWTAVVKTNAIRFFYTGVDRRGQTFGHSIWLSILRNIGSTSTLHWWCILHIDPRNSTKRKPTGNSCQSTFECRFNWNSLFVFQIFFGSQATVRVRKRLIRIDVADGGEFVRFLHLFFVAGDEIEHQPGTINDVCVCVLIKHRVRIKL